MATTRKPGSLHIGGDGLDEMIDALRELRTTGIQRAQRKLDDALDRTAMKSHELAHVHEGSLRASQSHSSTHEAYGWQGQISFDARGAAFEMQRGDDHAAFIDSLSALSEKDFTDALDSLFDDF